MKPSLAPVVAVPADIPGLKHGHLPDTEFDLAVDVF
jgi:hypothetical protein